MTERVREQFGEGLALHRRGQLAAAAAHYRQVLQAEPGHAEALHMLGVLQLQQGDPAAAETLIREALRLNPTSAAAHNNLGNVLLALGREDEAIPHYEQALVGQPGFVEALFNLGRALQALGRHEAAIAAYDRAIALRPAFAEAHNNRGNALQALGRLDEAIAALQQTVAIAPELAPVHNNLGVVLQALHRPAEAMAHHERSLAIAPENAEALNNLGNALRALGRNGEAIDRFRQAIVLNPAIAEIHVNAGSALLALDQPEAALDCFERALALKPDYAEAEYNAGIALQALKRDEQAVGRYEKALVSKPDYAEAHNNLGNALLELGRVDAAMQHYDKALSLKPDFPEVHANRGTALRGLGRMDDALQAFAKAAELAPRTTRSFLDLVDCKRIEAGDPHLAAMEALARDAAPLGEEARMYLAFALGKAYDDLGRYEEAFRCLIEANALKRKSLTYDEAATSAEFDHIRAAFSAAVLRRPRGGGSDLPVFIIGMPRSGSTLVAQILGSHPQVHVGGELIELPQAVAALRQAGAPGEFPEAVAAMSDRALDRFAESYLAPVRALNPAARRIVDKMPSNFRFAGLIHLALPKARIIHTRRDPVDTCLSCFSKLFTAGQPFTYDLGELGRYYRAYDGLMAHWRSVLPPDAMLELDYETVVANLEGEARRIVAHCGLDWDAACLSFHQTRSVVRTASAAQVRQPIYRTSVGRWQRYGQQLRPLLQALQGDTAD